MIEFVRFQPEHLRWLTVQKAQADEMALLISHEVAEPLRGTVAFSGFLHGEMVGCAGIVDEEEQSAVWALMSDKCGPELLRVTRFVRQILDHYPTPMFVATVRPDFDAGRRWLEMLRFTPADTPVNGYMDYERINERP